MMMASLRSTLTPCSHLNFSPVLLSGKGSRAITSCRTASCKGNRVMSPQNAHFTKLSAAPPGAARKLRSLFKTMALLSAPLFLSELLLPSAAKAFDFSSSSSSRFVELLLLADLDPTVASVLMRILGPVFASLNFLFIIRIVMSWYPQLPVDKFPYIIAFAPTEPVLEPTRKLIPPVGGVDVSPVIWVALMSFLNEVLLGQQGLLVLLSQQQG